MKIPILAMAILTHTVIAHTIALPCERLGGAMETKNLRVSAYLENHV